jgi:hypothetical protein
MTVFEPPPSESCKTNHTQPGTARPGTGRHGTARHGTVGNAMRRHFAATPAGCVSASDRDTGSARLRPSSEPRSPDSIGHFRAHSPFVRLSLWPARSTRVTCPCRPQRSIACPTGHAEPIGPTAAGASVSARAEYPPHTLPRPPPCVTLTTACRMRSSVGVGRLRRDGRGRRGYRRTPCPRAFLMARPHRGRVPDGYPRAAIGSCRPMPACAPDAVGLLPDMRRLGTIAQLSIAFRQSPSTDMICMQRSLAIPRS